MFRLRAVLATVVAGSLLVACSEDDPEPKVAEPTPSVVSSPAVGTAPASTAPTTLGPEETVRAWVEARNHALQDGITADAEALSSAACTTCEESLKPIRDVYSAGGHFETLGWKVLASRVVAQSSSKARVSTGIEYAEGRTFPDANSAPISYEAEKHVVMFRLVMEDGTWRLAFIGYLS